MSERKLTDPLGDAPRVSGAAALGADPAGDGVLLQLQVVVHAGHVQRRAKLNLIWSKASEA